MFRLFLSASVLTILLSGCSTPQVVEIPPTYPPALVQDCPDQLPKAQDGTNHEILRTAVEWAQMYHECKDRHNALVEVIRGETD